MMTWILTALLLGINILGISLKIYASHILKSMDGIGSIYTAGNTDGKMVGRF